MSAGQEYLWSWARGPMVKAVGGKPRCRPNGRHGWVLEGEEQEEKLKWLSAHQEEAMELPQNHSHFWDNTSIVIAANMNHWVVYKPHIIMLFPEKKKKKKTKKVNLTVYLEEREF